MELATAAAAVTAGTAAAAYLDAKFHLRKDLFWIRGRAAIRRAALQAAKEKRLSMYYFLEHHAQQQPHAEAIWSRAGCFTRAETLERANQWAQWFLRAGVKPGDLVGLFMLNSPEFIFAWVGLWAVGAAPAMLNYHLTGKALMHCLSISGAKLVLVDGDDAAVGRINEVRGIVEAQGVSIVQVKDIKDEVYALPATRPDDELRQNLKPGDPFALFFTSGTTGLPKAGVLPVIAGFGHATGILNPVQGPNQRYYVCMPYYHGTGGINVMAQLLCGTTVCIAPKFSVSGFWQDIRDSRATWFVYVGETLRYLLSSPPSTLDKMHSVHSVYGNGLRPDVWHRFKERFGIDQVWEFFNSTEGMLSLDNPSRNDYTALAVGHHGLLQKWRYLDSYIPVAIDPETGDIARDPKTGFAKRMPYEVGGEILVKAEGFERAFSGYYKNPDATEKKFIYNVFKKGDKYYRTGDALRRDNEGRWFFLDRLGDTFRWKGENVSTTEVSEVLGKYPGILEANVYGVEIPGHDGKAGAAAIFIDPALKDSFDHQGLLAHARTHLPKYAVPLFLRHVSSPSATHNNKQNKVPLKQEGVHPEKVQGGDPIYWIEKHGRGVTYVPFTRQDWDDLHVGKAKL